MGAIGHFESLLKTGKDGLPDKYVETRERKGGTLQPLWKRVDQADLPQTQRPWTGQAGLLGRSWQPAGPAPGRALALTLSGQPWTG